MPKRPRSHQLESESRVAFRSLLPSTWVVRDLDQDYGIDAQVEIFDEDDEATGLTFLVQLKATDSKKLKEPPQIRIKRDKANYYWSLDQPILIVLFHAPSGRLFLKWLHSWDTFYERKTEKSCTFTFDSDLDGDTDLPGKLVATLQSLRVVRGPRFTKHFPVEIKSDNTRIHGFDVVEIVAALKAEEREIGRWLKFTGPNSDDDESVSQITLSAERTAVSIAGMHGTSIHTKDGYPGTKEEFVADILVAIGTALHWHGHSEHGAQLIAAYCRDSLFVRSTRFCALAAQGLVAGNRYADAIALMSSLFDDEENWDHAFMCYHGLASALFSSRTPEPDKVAAAEGVVAVASRIADRAPLQAASMFYNAANVYRGRSDYRNALRMYRSASKVWPEYMDRKYFTTELAGVLFELERYRLSAKFYAASLEDNQVDDLRARYADALFFSGEYEKAERNWEEYVDSGEKNSDPEWIFKYECVKFLISETGLKQQSRKPSAAASEDVMQDALKLDALDPRAWWNLGQEKLKSNSHVEAMCCFLLSAFRHRADEEALLNAAACAYRENEPNMLTGILLIGIRWFGNQFYVDFMSRFEGSDNEEFRRLAMDSMKYLPDHDESSPLLLRFHVGDPKYDLVTTEEVWLR